MENFGENDAETAIYINSVNYNCYLLSTVRLKNFVP